MCPGGDETPAAPAAPQEEPEASMGVIEAGSAEDEEDEFDPVEGWDAGSTASTSISSSIYAHEYDNGRRYHSYKHGRYPIPNDDIEQNREDMKHAMMLELTDGRLHYSRISDNPQKIIDIGTGTGIWAIEMGDQYPSAEVTGIDLSPIQPSWIPPNVKFLVDDCEDEWMNGSDFDLVHFRTMSAILKNLQPVIDQAYPHIKPGGWIEFQELYGHPKCDDGTMPDDDPVKRFYELAQESFKLLGMDLHRAAHVGTYLEKAGFRNVRCIEKKIPIGTWAKDKTLRLVGLYLKLAIRDVAPSLANKPFEALGIRKEEREVWLASVRKSLEDTNPHRYMSFYFWYAQKEGGSA